MGDELRIKRMEEWKMALEAAGDIVDTRVNHVLDLLKSNRSQLHKLLHMLQPDHSPPVLRMLKPPADPPAQRHCNTGLSKVRKSVPAAMISPRFSVGRPMTRPSLPAVKTPFIQAGNGKKRGDAASKTSTPTKSPKQSEAIKAKLAPVIPILRPKPKLGKAEEHKSILSVSDFNGTAFLDVEDVRDVGGVSPIPGCNSPSVDDDIEVIQRDLAQLP